MRKSGEIPETPSIANYVFSRRWKPGKRDGFEVVSGSLTAFVKKLKRRRERTSTWAAEASWRVVSCKRIWWTNFSSASAPILLGDGVPGFPGKFPQRNFKLTECKSYSNGSVGLRYERIRTKTSR